MNNQVSIQRLQNIKAAAQEVRLRIADFLRSGLFRIVEKMDESTELLRRRCIDNQAPGIAAILGNLSLIGMDSPYWKQQLVASVSRIYMLTSAICNYDTLPAEWQSEVLSLSGVSFPQAMVMQGDAVSDTWMCLAATKEVFNSITMIKTWFVGDKSNRMACCVEYMQGTSHIATMLSPGNCYKADFHYYPGIHSIRVIYPNIQPLYSKFAPKAFAGVATAVSICRKALQHNPFMQDIPLIVSGLRLSRMEGRYLIADNGLNAFPIEISESDGARLLAATGGGVFSAFVIFHEFCCEIVSFWASGKYYVLGNE